MRKCAAGTVVVTVRVDSKLLYLAELAARKHRRKRAGYIVWAIHQALIRDDEYNDLEALWHPDEAARLEKLATFRPDLLTYDEQVRWKDMTNPHCVEKCDSFCARGELRKKP